MIDEVMYGRRLQCIGRRGEHLLITIIKVSSVFPMVESGDQNKQKQTNKSYS